MRKTMIPSLLALAGLLFGAASAQADSDEHPVESFQVSTITAIPGHTLAPGTYTIRVVDHLSDRYILRVDGTGEHTLFLGLPSHSMPHKTGELLWPDPAAGATYVRGWDFRGIPAPLEFVYPKNDAVAIAKANHARVPAIDPESDGMIVKTSLTKDEAQVVTLWLLTPTAVGPKTPAGIKAQRYTQVASLEHKPVIKRLPHTASELPIFWLLGGMALVGAGGMRLMRLSVGRS